MKDIEYYTVTEVAEIFRVDIKTVYGWGYRNIIRIEKIAGTVRIEKKEIERLRRHEE